MVFSPFCSLVLINGNGIRHIPNPIFHSSFGTYGIRPHPYYPDAREP
jgi:hypothetical protein